MLLYSEARAGTLEEVSLLRRGLRRALNEIRLSTELVDDVQLIFSEISANAIEHAERPPENMEVRVSIKGPMLCLEVIDDGSSYEGFDGSYGESAPQLVEAKGLDSALIDGGRGIQIIRDLADRIEYFPGSSNRLQVWLRLTKRMPTVLIVEDEPVLAQAYALGLAKDYKTIVVDTIEDALTEIELNSIDVVIADYHLPDGTGRTLAVTLESDLKRLPIPFILITGDNNTEIQRQMLEIGVEAALQKPVSRNDLADNIRLALRRAERRRVSHFRHFGAASGRLLTQDMPSEIGDFDLGLHSVVADLGSGDAMLHLPGEDRERVILMDVMGHGLGAHSSAIALSAILRSVHWSNLSQNPSEFLSSFSNLLFQDASLGQLICTLLVIDILPGNIVETASAGHPMPIHVSGVSCRPLDVGGSLPGFAADLDFPMARLEMAEGDRMFFFTDGLDPAGLSAGEPLPDWLALALKLSNHRPLNEAIGAIAGSVKSFLGPEPEDDWTLMAIEPRR